MGVFDKLMFWKKKEDDLGLGNLGAANPNMGAVPDDPFSSEIGMPQQQFGQYRQQYSQQQYPGQFQQPSFSRADYPGQQGFQSPQGYGNKDLEVVSAKLDALKAYMDSVNQRLANLERLAEQQSSGRRW
jgi:hypothetical protein